MLRFSSIIAFCLALSACDTQPLIEPARPGPGGFSNAGGESGFGGAASGCSAGRPILTRAVTNARDMGGTLLENGGNVACGQLYRGAPLSNFASDACEDFRSLGIRTVIDLRMEEERILKPDSPCVAEAANIVLTPLPIPWNVSRADYIADLDTKPSIAAAMRVFGDPEAYPVYFHCTWGRDRTGVLGAVLLLALGASREQILSEYLLSQANVGAYPDSLIGVLEEVERRGGVEAYLTATGVSMADVEALRAQAIAP